MKHRKLRADEDKYDPQMEKKCLKTLKDTVWIVHPQVTSVFLLEKIKTVMPSLTCLIQIRFVRMISPTKKESEMTYPLIIASELRLTFA